MLSLILVSTFKIPLVATLVSTIVAAGWITAAWIFRMHSAAQSAAHLPTNQMVYYPCKSPRQMSIRSSR